MSAAAPLVPYAGVLGEVGRAPDSLSVLRGLAPGFLTEGFRPAPGLPLSQAMLRGVPRFNPDIPEHVVAAKAEEDLANVVQAMPDEQVVRWGDPIGSHGGDVISVNRRTGEVALWDSKYRSANVRVQHSPTFAKTTSADGQVTDSDARAFSIAQARETIGADQTLPPAIKQRALDNLSRGQIKTRTVGQGSAKNSVIGN